jgi:cardiolipin synthase
VTVELSQSAASIADHRFQLLVNGAAAIAAVESLINSARHSVCLEMYIYKGDATGARIRAALLAAVQRRVRVRILLDDFGSAELPKDFFSELVVRGADLRFFNPSRVLRVAFRNHRKLVVADDRQAIVGGFNIGDEYAGDGVDKGWRDLGMQVTGPIVLELEASFDRMFIAAQMNHSAFSLFARRRQAAVLSNDSPELLTSGPGFGGASLRRSLYRDLLSACSVDIMTAYFAPTWMLRRRLARAAQRGRVQLILPAKTDVSLLRLAGQHLYSRLLREGAHVFEYQPQILHAKLLILDEVLYIGSCNLDVRSLRLNFELLVRVPDAKIVQQARELFAADTVRSKVVVLEDWEQSSTWWRRFERQVAFWLVTRLDPLLARRRLRTLR